MKWTFLMLFFMIGFASAGIDGVIGIDLGYKLLDFNNNTAYVNNSLLWNGNLWSDTRWLNIDGSNANQDIDIGTYNFYANSIVATNSIEGQYASITNYLTAGSIRLEGTKISTPSNNLDIDVSGYWINLSGGSGTKINTLSDTFTFTDGSITASSGAIDFDDEDLITTGNITADDLDLTMDGFDAGLKIQGASFNTHEVEFVNTDPVIARWGWRTATNDGTDNNLHRIYGSDDLQLIYGFAAAGPLYEMLAVGAPLLFATVGNSNQLQCEENGDVTIGAGDLVFKGSGTGLSHGIIAGDDRAVVCTNQNQWYQVTFDECGSSNKIVCSTADNDMEIEWSGVYDVGAHFSVHSSTAGADWEIQVKKNNADNDLFHAHMFQTSTVAGRVYGNSCNTLDDLESDDTLELWVRCTSSAGKTIVFDHVSLKTFMIGG